MNKLSSIFVFFIFALNVSYAQVDMTTAVDFTVTDKNGIEHHLYDILETDRYVLIDFFTYNCVPCCEIWPDLDKLYKQFGCNSQNLFVLSIEGTGNLGQLDYFEENCGGGVSDKPVVSGVEGGGAEVFELYNPGAYPTLILIAPDKTILENDIWPFNYQIGESRMLNYDIEHGLCPGPDNVDEIGGIEEIKISPNPSTGTTQLELSCSESTFLNIELINLTGQAVKQIDSKNFFPGYSSIQIDTNDFPSGTYFVKVTSTENRPFLSKLMIIN